MAEQKEVKYHKTYYGSYNRNVKKPELEGATRYDGYETAFKQLADVVDEKVFDNMGIIKMTELWDTSLDMLDEIDIDSQNHCTQSSKPDAEALR